MEKNCLCYSLPEDPDVMGVEEEGGVVQMKKDEKSVCALGSDLMWGQHILLFNSCSSRSL